MIEQLLSTFSVPFLAPSRGEIPSTTMGSGGFGTVLYTKEIIDGQICYKRETFFLKFGAIPGTLFIYFVFSLRDLHYYNLCTGDQHYIP